MAPARPLFIGLVLAAGLGGAVPVQAQAARNLSPRSNGPNAALQPGDMVRLRIWREPEMSGDYRVDEYGMAVLPRIGAMAVGQVTADSLRTLLVAIYSEHLRNPAVEVIPLRRVNVLGAVRSPGLYHVDPTMTVADVLAMAGGVTPDGKSGRVELLRDSERVNVNLSQQALVVNVPIRSGDQFFVPQRSWLSRNVAVVTATVTGAAIVVAALINSR